MCVMKLDFGSDLIAFNSHSSGPEYGPIGGNATAGTVTLNHNTKFTPIHF